MGISYSKDEALAMLSEKGISYNVDEFVDCAATGDAEAVNLFLSAGMKMKPNLIKDALDIAAMYGQTACVKVLLENGADVNRGGPLGNTPLMAAARNSEAIDTVKLLLDSGADVNAKDRAGETVIYFAARGGSAEIIKVLCGRGDWI